MSGRDCTTCVSDTETLNCKQGHMREWHHELGLEKGKRIPIQNCHAWEEKECSCSNIRWSRGVMDIFDITCRKCGRKSAGEKPILSEDCVCQIAKFFKG